ncbi:PRTRC system protein E [Desulfovibrio oxyclinae]|uniref:PRTRC system protein E n=1 Tax=Desulfovibrio oxyclinae TaxID=63560 RepID=UPI00037238EB|nr:PRTRC system protein E [Desulfovibrio oxyclinae]
MFEVFDALVPQGGTLAISVSRADGERLTVSVLPRFSEVGDHKNALLKPITVKGTPAELNEFIVSELAGFAQDVADFDSTLEQAREQLRQQGKAARAKAGGGNPDRTQGEADEAQVETLCQALPGSDPFKETLGKACSATLEAAFAKVEDLAVLRPLATELKKIVGKEADGYFEQRLTALYKDGKGDKSAVGKELEKITGKTLADLGLKAKQASMF